jgi:SAM-dependent methyltransferase
MHAKYMGHGALYTAGWLLNQVSQSLAPSALIFWAQNQRFLQPLRMPEPTKLDWELRYWEQRWRESKWQPDTTGEFLMEVGNIESASFFGGKVLIDIGCGPMGTLAWADMASERIGVDPLADRYRRFDIASHNMKYLKAFAENIPLADEYADVVFSTNSLDHVDDLQATVAEIRRILKPEGHFIGSINLQEEPTRCEPQVVTRDFIDRYLFKDWVCEFERTAPEGASDGSVYKFFHEQPPPGYRGKYDILWCRYSKPQVIPSASPEKMDIQHLTR